MAVGDLAFTGSIPDIYDSHMVPLIFQIYAEDMAARVASRTPSAVLETAAGSGVLTRALAARLGSDTRLVVTDYNPPMLERARSVQGPDDRIEWRPADALDLPFPDAAFDALCCQFGLMFYPDRVQGHREARRVLRPGGHYVFNVWDGIETNDFARVVTEAASEVFPDDPPIFMARIPHGFGDTALHRREVAEAGFRDITVSTVEAESYAPNARFAAIAFCQGTPLRNEIEARDPARLSEVTDRAEAALERAFGSGPIAGRICGHVVEAAA